MSLKLWAICRNDSRSNVYILVYILFWSLKRHVAQMCRLSDVAQTCTYFCRSKLSLEQAYSNAPLFSQIGAKNVGFFAVYSKNDDLWRIYLWYLFEIRIVEFLIPILARKMLPKNFYQAVFFKFFTDILFLSLSWAQLQILSNSQPEIRHRMSLKIRHSKFVFFL